MLYDESNNNLYRDAMGLLAAHATHDREGFRVLSDTTNPELLWALCGVLISDLKLAHSLAGVTLIYEHILGPLEDLDRFFEPDTQAARALNLVLLGQAGYPIAECLKEIKAVVGMFKESPVAYLWQLIGLVAKVAPLLQTPRAVEAIQQTLLYVADNGHPDTPGR